METRELKYGDRVIFFDSFRVRHDALVTEVWAGKGDGEVRTLEKPYCCINLLYVSKASNRVDQYGRQSLHESSVTHGDEQNPPRLGNHWLFADEV